MSRRIESALFTVTLSAAAMLFLAMAWGLESKSRLAPLLLAGAILPLTLYQLRLDLASGCDQRSEPAPPQEKQSLAWALALPPAIYLIGCLGAVSLHTLLFVRIQGSVLGGRLRCAPRWRGFRFLPWRERYCVRSC